MMHLQYVDDEGDKVLLATDSDLVAAVNFARISGWKVSLMYYVLLEKICRVCMCFCNKFFCHVPQNGASYFTQETMSVTFVQSTLSQVVRGG